MAAELFEEVERTLPKMEALHIAFKLIWGATDPYLNIGVAEDFQSHLKRPSLHVLPAGHWVQINAPEQVARLMLTDA